MPPAIWIANAEVSAIPIEIVRQLLDIAAILFIETKPSGF